jgi:hypothetical protein
MSIRTAPSRRAGRSRVVRGGVVALAVLGSSALGLPSAAAAPAVTIPLTPPEVEIVPYPVENTGPLTPELWASGPASTPVDAEYGGQIVVQIPAPLDGSAMDVDLELAPAAGDLPTRTYSTTTPGPDQLVLSDLGGGQYAIALPADDTVNGPFGALVFSGLTSPDSAVQTVGFVVYELQFTGTGVAVVNLAPQMLVLAQVVCPLSSGTRCPAIPVDAGTAFGISVPPTSLLRTLGLGSFDHMRLGLDALDSDGYATGDDTFILTDHPGLVTVADSYNATVTLPRNTRGGAYGLTLVQATGTAGLISVTFGELQVTGVPAPAPRIVNAGLRSDTGWGETPDAGPAHRSSPLVAAGAGMLALAGAGTAVAQRMRRRPSATCAD